MLLSVSVKTSLVVVEPESMPRKQLPENPFNDLIFSFFDLFSLHLISSSSFLNMGSRRLLSLVAVEVSDCSSFVISSSMLIRSCFSLSAKAHPKAGMRFECENETNELESNSKTLAKASLKDLM